MKSSGISAGRSVLVNLRRPGKPFWEPASDDDMGSFLGGPREEERMEFELLKTTSKSTVIEEEDRGSVCLEEMKHFLRPIPRN